MKAFSIDGIKGKDLPADWAARGEVRPDEEGKVIVTPNEEALRHELIALMAEMGKAAEANGLTGERLRALVPSYDPKPWNNRRRLASVRSSIPM